jgi:hypothetical protein
MYLLRPNTSVASWGRLLLYSLLFLTFALPQAALSQTKRPSNGQAKRSTTSTPPSTPSAGVAVAQNPALGSISGTVVDQQGAVAEGALIEVASGDAPSKQTLSGPNGEYSFANVTPGPFHLTVTAPGFDTKIFSGEVHAGQPFLVPAIALTITAVAEVTVQLTPIEVAEEEVKVQEQQRVLGIFPNFYVSYVADAAPLIPRQKYRLAWKSVSDPITILGAGALAGLYQAADEFPGYGEGAEGYAKRFGAAYADVVIGTFVGGAILPSLLKQDPRYFYQGTGSTRSRLLHAISSAVVCKGDNKKLQPNYSSVLGSFASGAASYVYYPASDRSTSLFLQNSLVRVAEDSLSGVIQEFILRRFTTVRGKKQSSTTQP